MNPKIQLKLFKNKRSILLFAAIVCMLNIAPAQEVYDLNRCITDGLEQNFSIKVIRNQEDIANNNYTRGNAGMLPRVSSINKIGGTLNSINNESPTSANGTHNTYASAGVDLGMTIFKGFFVQRTYQKLGQLSNLQGITTQMSVENLVAQITSEYNYYIQQIAQYQTLAYAVMLSRERVRIDEQRYLLGSASKVELLQSKVYLNSDSSRYSKQNELIRSSQIRLNQLMASENLGQHVIPADSLIHINETLKYDELLAQTLELNTGLQIASKNQEITETDYKIIASRAYPYLTLKTGYDYNYRGAQTGTTTQYNANGIANYGLTLGLDLFDGFNQKREKTNALIELENKKLKYSEIEQAVKSDLLTVFYAYENNIRLLRLEEQNLEVARENLEIALERYKLGSLSGLELREVQKSLLDAEERLISVKYLTKLAEISLLQISGNIMDYL